MVAFEAQDAASIRLDTEIRNGRVGGEGTRDSFAPLDQADAPLVVDQVLAADGAPAGEERAALARATPLAIDEVVDLVHRHGGLAVAAHIDRRSFGVIGQLGLFPHEAGFDAVELSRHVAPGSEAAAAFREYGLPILHSSDSHYRDDIGAARTTLHVMASSFAELVLALHGADGRSIADA